MKAYLISLAVVVQVAQPAWDLLDGVNSGANKGARFYSSVFRQFRPYRTSWLCDTLPDTKKRAKRHGYDICNIIFPNSATSAERSKIWRLLKILRLSYFQSYDHQTFQTQCLLHYD